MHLAIVCAPDRTENFFQSNNSARYGGAFMLYDYCNSVAVLSYTL